MSSCSFSDAISGDDIISNHVTLDADNGSLYARIDQLLDSTDSDKCMAFDELLSQENLVCLLLVSFYAVLSAMVLLLFFLLLSICRI